MNTGTVSSQARLNFFDDNGNPLPLPLTFPQASTIAQPPVATIDRTLSPGATLIIESRTGQPACADRLGPASE